MRVHGLATAIAAAVVLALPAARPAGAAEWSTSYGAMTLPDVPGGPVRAPYADDNGRLLGQFLQPKCPDCGVTLTGVWVEDGSGSPCPTTEDGSAAWGSVTLEFDPGFTRFDGLWGYCDAAPEYTWRGSLGAARVSRSPPR